MSLVAAVVLCSTGWYRGDWGIDFYCKISGVALYAACENNNEQKQDPRCITAFSRVAKGRGNNACCIHAKRPTRGVIYSVFDARDLHTAFIIVLPVLRRYIGRYLAVGEIGVMKRICNCYGSTEACSFPGSIITLPSFDEKTYILDSTDYQHWLIKALASWRLWRRERYRRKSDPIEFARDFHVLRPATSILEGRNSLWRR